MLAPVSTAVTIVVVGVIGFVLGSIPVALLVARRHGVADLRDVGDRNPGYWNTMEQLGRRAALPVFVGDAAKGAAAAAVGLAASDRWWMPLVGGGAAMVGHSYPVFAGFRGGRSVLTFVGTAIVFSPFAALAALASMMVVYAASRKFDWAARVGVFAYPVWLIVIDGPYRTAAIGILMSFVGLRFALAAIVDRRVQTA